MKDININITDNLTPLEKEVIDTIDEIRKKRTPSTVIRIAGGWVRDKLLGKASDDIDFMTDNISGSKFAKIIAEELNLEKSPHVIKENPEKTKNIEATKMYVPFSGQNVELDLVQSRKEEYGENRREVTTKPATAEEDAMRRDLTINALFYNINTKEVEDFTGKGIKDLITNTIRTPYDSGMDNESVDKVKKTFIEDPLRVFRTIRFSAKYNGNISPATREAIQDPEVIDAIFFSERKIAPDRIGQEFKKMMAGPNPEIALKTLKDSGLLEHILSQSTKGTKFEDKMEILDMEQNNPHHDFSVWGHTYQVILNLLEHFPYEDEQKRVIMILGALTHDLGKLFKEIHAESKSHPGRTSYHGHEHASEEICKHMLAFLKFERDVIKQVSGLARYHMQAHNLERQESQESALRKYIRRMGEASLNWIDVFNLSVADAYSKGANIKPETMESYSNLRNRLNNALESMNMEQGGKIQPLLDGREIMNTLNIKPGAHMKYLVEYLKDLQDKNPSISKEEAKNKLTQIKNNAENISKDENIEFVEALEKSLSLTASQNKNSLNKNASACPKQLFKKIEKDLEEAFNKKNYTKVISILKIFYKNYKEDDLVSELASKYLLKTLCKNKKVQDNELLQFVIERAKHNLYNPVLNSNVIALLILLKTNMKDEDILEISKLTVDLDPEKIKNALKHLPKNVENKNVLKILKKKINENC